MRFRLPPFGPQIRNKVTVYRLILPDWRKAESSESRKVLEGEFGQDEISAYNNSDFYNVYFLPNYPSHYEKGVTVDGSHIDTFEYVFVDFDLKEEKYPSKDAFIEALGDFPLQPTRIIDSGNGIHAYWRVQDLDAKSYLKLQRRLMRRLNTDEAVCKIYQLMRAPLTINTKDPDNLKLCEVIFEDEANTYTAEQVDAALPPLTHADETYCQQHYDKTFRTGESSAEVDEKIPLKFAQLVSSSQEVKAIWAGGGEDRSASDYRLGHIMFAHGFNKSEAMSVLVNCAKALSRAPQHRIAYAANIVDKIWTFEVEGAAEGLSSTVAEILSKAGSGLKGTRFPCYRYLDATDHGMRLGQVIGLVAGSGVGKTAMALNMFMGFVQNNPEYDHFFVPLEQPANEIADRWQAMCGDQTQLHEKVHVISNYADDGSFRRLSLDEIKDYLLEFQKSTGKKIGCVVIDHIGALKKETKDGENQGIMDICHQMKAFAVQTNTLLVMQSQSSREKAGIGDLEISKDAAYGTVFFEAYCDFLITIWQPLKRCYDEEGCPSVTAFKFCKIRAKKRGRDLLQEDVRYLLYFDPEVERFRELTQEEETSFDYFNKKATNKRGLDRKTDLIKYTSINWTKEL